MMSASQTNVDKRPPSPAQRAAPNSKQISVEDYWLDVALQDSFPCSDPISSLRSD
jgi:hypothetical protein